MLGDAELDEGAIWQAVLDPMVRELGEVLWVVDVNRQSLDRVVPGILAGRVASPAGPGAGQPTPPAAGAAVRTAQRT
jgi:pyruvate dehydrogenase E1 component